MSLTAVQIKSSPKDFERFSGKYKISEDGCWIWQGPLSGRGAEKCGHFWFSNSTLSAAKYSWLYYFGDTPPKHRVENKCGNRACVNPEHLKCVRSEIKPLADYEKTFLEKINKTDSGCWEWMCGLDEDGYGQIWLNNSNTRAHRFSYMLYKGEITPGLNVCHRCDNPKCANPDHLFLGTAKENQSDCIAKGRKVIMRGEKSVNAKLKAREVAEIKLMLSRNSIRMSTIATLFGVSSGAISEIANGRNWKHVAAATTQMEEKNDV